MNKIILFLTMVAMVFLYACKSTKPAQTVMVPTPSVAPVSPLAKAQTADELIQYSIHQRSNFEWFSANLSGSINLSGDLNTFNGQIRMKNGEEIWLTITKFGIEILRLRITTDSVFLHNKYERTATIRDFSFFREVTGVDLTFGMLQDILLGNYFLPEPNGEYSYEMVAGNYAFAAPRPIDNIWFDFVLYDGHCKFLSLTLRDAINRSVRADYGGYSIVNDALYPQNLSVQMKEPMELELKLNYQKIQINVPQTMPFSIPESVKKI